MPPDQRQKNIRPPHPPHPPQDLLKHSPTDWHREHCYLKRGILRASNYIFIISRVSMWINIDSQNFKKWGFWSESSMLPWPNTTCTSLWLNSPTILVSAAQYRPVRHQWMGATKGSTVRRPQMAQRAPKGYVCLVDHTLAQSEVGVWQVGQGLQQDLWGHLSLEVRWVELVPTEEHIYLHHGFSGLRWKQALKLLRFNQWIYRLCYTLVGW